LNVNRIELIAIDRKAGIGGCVEFNGVAVGRSTSREKARHQDKNNEKPGHFRDSLSI
jgi:hypothetical protein